MASVDQTIKNAMVPFLVTRGIDAVEVTGWVEEERYDGFCETCYYDYAVVVIDYIDSNGKAGDYEYYGEFADFIQELTTK